MRKILHVDMDAFYASVEERENPDLKGQPVIVGGSSGRGVVAAANYAARKFGVRSAMPVVTARRLCPDLVHLPVRMGLYAHVSHQIRDIFARYTPQIEPLSLDEAFLDVTASLKLFASAQEIAHAIKQDIRQELDLVASVGVAPNKFIAKIASDINKPDGFVVVDDAGVQAFLDPLPVSRLWGAGKVTVSLFERMGIKTISQLRRQSQAWLQSHFGQWGEHLWQLANGIDDRPVISESQARSISHETTFDEDLVNKQVLSGWLLHLTEQVASRLRGRELIGKTIVLKVRHHDFKTVTRSHSFPVATDNTDQLLQVVKKLFNDYWNGKTPIRLLGMGVSGITSRNENMQQGDLFASPSTFKIDRLADTINTRFGAGTLHRGRSKNRDAIKMETNE